MKTNNIIEIIDSVRNMSNIEFHKFRSKMGASADFNDVIGGITDRIQKGLVTFNDLLHLNSEVTGYDNMDNYKVNRYNSNPIAVLKINNFENNDLWVVDNNQDKYVCIDLVTGDIFTTNEVNTTISTESPKGSIDGDTSDAPKGELYDKYAKIETIEQEVPASEVEGYVEEADISLCPSCGTAVENADACPMCGVPIDNTAKKVGNDVVDNFMTDMIIRNQELSLNDGNDDYFWSPSYEYAEGESGDKILEMYDKYNEKTINVSVLELLQNENKYKNIDIK